MTTFTRDRQYYKFCAYGFLKELSFWEPFLLLFLQSKGLGFLTIGSLYAFREVAINVLQLPTGIMADGLGRKKTLITAFLGYIVSFVIFYFSHNVWLLFSAMLMFAWGEAFRSGTHKAMIFSYLRLRNWSDQTVHYYGATRSWSQIGAAISALIGGIIVFVSGRYDLAFLLSIIPFVLNLLLIWSYPDSLDEGAAHNKISELGRAVADLVSALGLAIRNPGVLRALLNLSGYSSYYKSNKDYLQPVLKAAALALPLGVWMTHTQRTAILISGVYFLLFMLSALCSRYAGWFSERFSRVESALNITLLSGYGLGLVSGFCFYREWFGLAVLSFIGINVIENLRKPIGISNLSNQIDPKIMASALSVQSLLETVLGAGTALLIGFLADSAGVAVALIAVATLMLALCPGIWLRDTK